MSTHILVLNGSDADVTVDGQTVKANSLKRLSSVSDADVAAWAGTDGVMVGKAGTPHIKGVKASYTSSMTGAQNDVKLTAVSEGTAGNSITITLTQPAIVAALDVSVVGSAITAALGTAGGTKSALSTSLTGADNDLVYTAVLAGVGGDSIRLRYVDPGGTTAALSVSVSGNDITVNLGRAASAINSTAALVKAAIEASGPAAALVTVANKAANDGSGLVTALSYTALSGGVAPPITTTATALMNAINADTEASALVVASLKSGNDGTGLVTALSVQSLSGGVAQVAGGPSAMEGKPRRVVARLLRYSALR